MNEATPDPDVIMLAGTHLGIAVGRVENSGLIQSDEGRMMLRAGYPWLSMVIEGNQEPEILGNIFAKSQEEAAKAGKAILAALNAYSAGQPPGIVVGLICKARNPEVLFTACDGKMNDMFLKHKEALESGADGTEAAICPGERLGEVLAEFARTRSGEAVWAEPAHLKPEDLERRRN